MTSFKPFVGRIGEVQTNARENWRRVFPGCRVKDFASGEQPPEFGACAKWATENGAGWCLWTNGDILFSPLDVDGMLGAAADFAKVLIVGKRINMTEDGEYFIQRPIAVDYFIFKSGMFTDMPPTTVGRGCYDSAIVAYCIRRGIPVVDATDVITAIHQWHDYSHAVGGRLEVYQGEDAGKNALANGLRPFAPHIADCTHAFHFRGGRIVLRKRRRPLLRALEAELYYRCGYAWCPRFNQLWNLLTFGGGKPRKVDVREIEK